MKANKTTIRKGDTVTATFAWTENEQPSDKIFFTGKVKNVIRKRGGIIYFELENLSREVPADRVQLA
ncbi:MAG TPA: hypothetical protein VGB68_18865 [Pyrinomonadaceae bacterium]|jgi:hypothetical protein